METKAPHDDLSPRAIALLAGLALGLGILVDVVFLLIAAAIGAIVPMQWLWRHFGCRREKAWPTHHHA